MEKNSSQPYHSFLKVKAYSVEQVFAAGGTTAFANNLGKNFQDTIKRLESVPTEDFLTEDEANAALAYLRNNK